jgi:hypothetical protein
LQDKELGISHLYRGLEQLVVYGIWNHLEKL